MMSLLLPERVAGLTQADSATHFNRRLKALLLTGSLTLSGTIRGKKRVQRA